MKPPDPILHSSRDRAVEALIGCTDVAGLVHVMRGKFPPVQLIMKKGEDGAVSTAPDVSLPEWKDTYLLKGRLVESIP